MQYNMSTSTFKNTSMWKTHMSWFTITFSEKVHTGSISTCVEILW